MRSAGFQHMEDSELFLKVQDGSEAAFYELFSRHWEKLYVIAKSILRNDAMAEDLVQDVFTDFWERRKRIVNNNIKAYLSQSIRYQVFKQLRKTELLDVHAEALASIPVAGQTDDMLNYKELQHEIENVLETLPGRCREIFHLSRYEYLSNNEIAQRLNISVRTVETQISIALKHLRNALAYTLLWYISRGGI